ncbi:hypothetical protein NESM_000048800 [Novymonas esmeraldas]|uniref:Uncharacterized protein n=1 Tax=Novymonas esmeraldas TaxID=1808958 RepID=A0AAW0F2A4_9TRYP
MLRRCASAVAPAAPSCCAAAAAAAGLQKRFLKIAKSTFGFYLARKGQRKFPFHRRPHTKNTHAMNLNAPYYWSFMTAKSQSFFLPEENYITGDWTGKFFVSKRQVYTLQHATSGGKVRVKSFPSVFEMNSPSRWNVGKEMNTLTKPRMDLIDDQMLTKKQRLDYVKAGFLPK